MPGHNDWYSLTTAPADFGIEFNPPKFQKMSVDAAADYTARLIYENHKNLWLSFSGGYDSEFVANVLLRNSIPFVPIIWKDKLYNMESDYALYWCRKNKIEPRIVSRYFNNKHHYQTLEHIANKIKNNSTLASITVELAFLAEKENARLILGTGECFCNDPYPEIMEDQTEFAEHDWFVDILFPGKHVGAFFCYTPELLYSMVTCIDTSLPTQEAKAKLYGLNFRPKIRPYFLATSTPFERRQYCSLGSLQDFANMLISKAR